MLGLVGFMVLTPYLAPLFGADVYHGFAHYAPSARVKAGAICEGTNEEWFMSEMRFNEDHLTGESPGSRLSCFR